MKQINRNLLKLSIIGIALVDAGNGATTPALGTIAAAMPSVDYTLVQSIATVPSLFLALTPILYAKLLDMGVKKRTLLYIGAAAFIIGGVGPYFLHNSIWTILVLRGVLGIGNGICLPLATDLVIDFFEGHERNTMQGFVSASVGLSGIIFQLLGGYFAGIRWDYTFLAYAVAVIFFSVAFVFLPEPDRKEKIAAQEGINDVGARAKLGGYTYLTAIIFGFYFLIWYICPTNSAMIMIKEGMAQPAQIGGIFALMTAGNLIISLTFGILFKSLKFKLLWISYISGAIGMYIMYTATSIGLYTVGITLLGVSLGAQVPTIISKLTGLVPYSAGAAAISLAFFAMGVGGFINPFVFKYLGQFAVGRPAFIFGAVAFVVLGVIMAIVDKKTPAKYVSFEKAV